MGSGGRVGAYDHSDAGRCLVDLRDSTDERTVFLCGGGGGSYRYCAMRYGQESPYCLVAKFEGLHMGVARLLCDRDSAFCCRSYRAQRSRFGTGFLVGFQRRET